MEPSTLGPADVTTNDTELSELELLKIENERLKAEVQALHQKDQDLKALADDVENKTNLWESLKEETKEANEKRITALEALADLAGGHVQTTIFGKEDGDDEEEMIRFPDRKPQTLNAGTDHMAVAGTFRSFQFAITREQMDRCDFSRVRELEPEVAKRKVGAVTCMGDALYAPINQRCFEDESGYFDLLPLLSPIEWEQRLAETYGPALFDLTDDVAVGAKEQRQAGGEFCGIVVKFGRKKYVIGPVTEAIRLIYGKDGAYAHDDCVASRLMAKGE